MVAGNKDHSEHWQEPSAVTAERPKGEKNCKSCGEDVPFHRASCSMLKNAYKRRYSKCGFCPERLLVGEKMREHVEANHQVELLKLVSGEKP